MATESDRHLSILSHIRGEEGMRAVWGTQIQYLYGIALVYLIRNTWASPKLGRGCCSVGYSSQSLFGNQGLGSTVQCMAMVLQLCRWAEDTGHQDLTTQHPKDGPTLNLVVSR